MEVSVSSVVGAITVVTLMAWTLKIVNWVWLRPKKMEKCLRRQGLKGNGYRLLYGDMKDIVTMANETSSRPMSLFDDIFPRIFPFDARMIEKHGRDYFLWFGPTPRVHITDPQLIREVFTKYNEFPKLIPKPIKRLITGLVYLEGEKWARHRRIINPAFHVEKLKLMLPAFDLCCSTMINTWKSLIPVEGSCELDVWPYLQNLAGDTISRTAFGGSYEKGKIIFQLQTEHTHLVMEALQNPYIPGWRFIPTKNNRRITAIEKTVNSVLRSIICKREEAMKVGEAAGDDLLSVLLESNGKEIGDHRNNKNVGMSLEDVIHECKLFYSAGQETTSVLLVWTIVLLSQHRDWQERARAEVLQAFGDKKLNYEGLNNLKIMTMILHEVLRLYPPIVYLVRVVHKETKLGDLTLPAGTGVQVPILRIHTDKNIWGDDANEFKPERFAEGVSKAAKIGGGGSAFLPFGAGPRICIGQNFAFIEAKLAMALILQHFTFELSTSYVHHPVTALPLQPKHGCRVVLHKR